MPGPAVTNTGSIGGEIFTNRHMGADKWRPFRIIEKVSFATAATATLNKQIPANAIIAAVQFKYNTAVVLSTAVKIGLGITGDPDSLILSGTTVTANTETSGLPLTTKFVSSATSAILTACDTNGAAAGTVTSGDVTVQIVGWYFDDIDDA